MTAHTVPFSADNATQGQGKTAPVTPDSVHDLLQFFARGGHLQRRYLERLLAQAYALLQAAPTVAVVRPPSPQHEVIVVGDLHGSLGQAGIWCGPKGQLVVRLCTWRQILWGIRECPKKSCTMLLFKYL